MAQSSWTPQFVSLQTTNQQAAPKRLCLSLVCSMRQRLLSNRMILPRGRFVGFHVSCQVGQLPCQITSTPSNAVGFPCDSIQHRYSWGLSNFGSKFGRPEASSLNCFRQTFESKFGQTFPRRHSLGAQGQAGVPSAVRSESSVSARPCARFLACAWVAFWLLAVSAIQTEITTGVLPGPP